MNKSFSNDDLAALEAALKNERSNQDDSWRPGCLGPDQILDLVEAGEKISSSMRPLLAHLAICSFCMHEFNDTQQTWNLSHGKSHHKEESQYRYWVDQVKSWLNLRPYIIGVGGLSVAGACLIIMGFVIRSGYLQNERATRQKSQLISKLESVQESNHQLQVAIALAEDTQTEQLSRLTGLQQEYNKTKGLLIAAQLKLKSNPLGSLSPGNPTVYASVKVSSPNDFSNYLTKIDRAMGGTTTSFALRSPVSTATVTSQPDFQWEAMPGADRYRLQISDSESRKAVAEEESETNHCALKAPLKRGRIYTWQVFAGFPRNKDELNQREIAGQPNPAKFKVLTEKEINELAKNIPARIALASSFINSGLMEEAVHELRLLEQIPTLTSVQRRKVNELIKLTKSTRRQLE